MVKFTPEVMQARFWELSDAREALVEETKPLREHRDALCDALRGPLAAMKAAKVAVVAVERPRMAEIDMEMATIARALKQNVGPRPSSLD